VYPNPNGLGDLVYKDTNGDGDQDAGELGIQNVIVHLLNSTTSDTLSTTLTNASGNYSFTGLPYGTFRVVIDSVNFDTGGVLENYVQTDDPDATLDDNGVSSYLAGGDTDLSLDFGYYTCSSMANNAVLNTCDNSNMAGQGVFFLHDANAVVSTESGVAISYHPSSADAENDTNILISPYTSTSVTIYARVEKISTGCVDISAITLNVEPKCVENCNNNLDDDGDGLIDCDDPDCPCCDAYAPTLNNLNKKDP
jgi:hypothetical protein